MDLNWIPILEEETEEDVLLMDYVFNTKNRTYHYMDREEGVFNLDSLGDSYCHTHFRFYKSDIRLLVQHLNIPHEIILKSRVKVGGEEALCILLHRLSYPKR